jgi:hypothetical protein
LPSLAEAILHRGVKAFVLVKWSITNIRLTLHLPDVTITLLAEVAQLVEHLTENQGVTSSILVLGIEIRG